MLTPTEWENLEILRRQAERGLALAQKHDPVFVDIFQHMLDTIKQTIPVMPDVPYG